MKCLFSIVLFFIIIICSTNNIAQNSQNKDVQTEENALIALYNATNGDDWTNNANWLSDEPLGDWFGVTTDEDGYVTELFLADNNLTGVLPQEIGDLTNLTNLFLHWNQIGGEIPIEFGNLLNLEEVYLADNQFFGDIPAEIGNLTNLWDLQAYQNQLSGEIPNTIGNLTNLIRLNLGTNELTGEIPSEIGNLVNMQEFEVPYNQISGQIPEEIGNLVSLQHLNLMDNQISGVLPVNIGNLTNIFSLALSNNSISGVIPTEIGNLINLTDLRLDNNQLDGEIPASIGNLQNLNLLYFHENQLSGRIPSELGDLFNLSSFYLQGNLLDSIPPAFSSFNLDLSGFYNNIFTFEELDNMPMGSDDTYYSPQNQIPLEDPEIVLEEGQEEIYSLPFDHNVTGSTYNWYRDGSFYQSTSNNSITVNDNDGGTHYYYVEITNTGFPDLTLQTDNLTVISNSSSSDEEKDALIALYNATDGDNWTNNTNWLSDEPLGDWFGITTNSEGNVTEIILYENNLNGVLGSYIGGFDKLEHLNIHSNELSGTLPSEIWSLEYLKYLALGANGFQGSLPSGISGLVSLEHLMIESNQFSGQIPSSIGTLSNLQKISLGINQFEGEFPEEFYNLQNLDFIDIRENQFSGNFLSELSSFSNLSLLIISNNHFTGEIPVEIGDLVSLQVLDLSSNQFEGQIPNSIEQLVSLQEFSIYDNYFDQFPAELNSFELTNSSASINYFSFEDIINFPEDLQYSPQRIIPIYDTTYLEAGIQGTIQLDFDNDITNSTYNWYRQGSFVSTTPENSLAVTEEFGGTFYYNLEITNTDFPGFTLEVDSVIVIVEGETNPNIEEEALIALYNATDGDNWTNNTNWLSDEPLGDWYGVTTNGDGFVTEISLMVNELYGSLPSELGNLSSLSMLLLNENQLNGVIPPELGNLSSLTFLHFWNNEISGSIPPAIGNLSNLTSLSIGKNQLSGEIPDELWGLSNLETFSSEENQLSGTLPSEIENLSNLNYLDLDQNQLSGEIPIELWNLDNLLYLMLGNNGFNGTLPSALGDLVNLSVLRLEQNQFSGSLPSELTNCNGLIELSINNNQFDSIPPSLSSLSLDYSMFQLNNFTIEDLENIPIGSEEHYYTPQNQISLGNPVIILEDGEEASYTLPFDYNVSSSTYNWYRDGSFYQSTNTNSIIVNDNDGETHLYFVEITNTNFPDLTLQTDNLTVISNISSSNIEEEALIALYNATDGDNWTNNTNWLSEEPLGDWYGVTTDVDGFVINIELNENSLNGTLPSEIGSLQDLSYLSLSLNQITGAIPEELGSLINLEEIDLSSNLLSGNIPIELGSLVNLRVLSLFNNQLTGTIPIELANLTELTDLLLGINLLTGSIPIELGALEALYSLRLDDNHFTGGFPSELCSNLELAYLDISNNKLDVPLPIELLNLSGLNNLYFESNDFYSFPSYLSGLSVEFTQAEYNYFSYEDLENLPPLASYTPQKTISIYDTTILEYGIEGIIQLDFDNDIINSTYNWHKEGQGLIATTNENSLSVIEENEGTYFYSLSIENSDFPDFYLSVDSVIVIVTDCGVSVSSIVKNIACKGESTGEIILNAVGGVPPYSYSIDNGTSFQSENIFSNLDLGAYQAVVVDNNDCYNYLDLEITEPLEFLTYNITTVDVTCFGGNDASIEIMAQGGNEPYVYSKDGGLIFQSSNIFENLSAEDYQIVLMDANKCETTELVHIQEPDTGPEVFFTGLETEYCDNSPIIELQGNQAPNGWFEGEGITDNNDGTAFFNPTILNLNQSYAIKYYYEDNLGCNGIDEQNTIVYESPIAAFNYSLGSCIESTEFIDLSSSQNGDIVNWNWSFDDPESEAANVSSIQNPLHYFVTNQSSFNVELIVEDEIGCSDTAIQPIEPYSTTTITGHVFTNTGEDITDGYVLAFLLSDGVISTQEDSVQIAEDASFTFVNLATCVDYIFHAYSNEELYPDIIPRWHFEAFYWFDAESVFVNWGDEFVDGVDISLFEVIPAPVGNSSVSGGVYYTGGKGEPVKNVDVVLEFDAADDKSYKIVGYQNTDELGRWKFSQLGKGDFKIKVDIPGLAMDSVYQVYIPNLNSDLTGLNYYIDPENGIYITPTGLDELDDLGFGSIGVFPNPNTGQFYLEIIKSEDISRLNINAVQLWDMEGRLIKDLGIEFKGDHYLTHLNLSDIEPGMYFIKVKNKEEFGVVKFVIQR